MIKDLLFGFGPDLAKQAGKTEAGVIGDNNVKERQKKTKQGAEKKAGQFQRR